MAGRDAMERDVMTASNTRYFYSDPLAAAWMAQHFGMRFVADDAEPVELKDGGFRTTKSGEDWQSWLSGEGNSPWRMVQKAYIHPDSLPLLEPQYADLCFELGWGYLTWECLEHMTGEDYKHDASFKIIQRAGKPFHWPQQEPTT